MKLHAFMWSTMTATKQHLRLNQWNFTYIIFRLSDWHVHYPGPATQGQLHHTHAVGNALHIGQGLDILLRQTIGAFIPSSFDSFCLFFGVVLLPHRMRIQGWKRSWGLRTRSCKISVPAIPRTRPCFTSTSVFFLHQGYMQYTQLYVIGAHYHYYPNQRSGYCIWVRLSVCLFVFCLAAQNMLM